MGVMTTVSLKMRIETAERAVWRAMRELDEARIVLMELQEMRLECTHEFTKPHPGFEHEGGYCTKCGINEVYWANIKLK